MSLTQLIDQIVMLQMTPVISDILSERFRVCKNMTH